MGNSVDEVGSRDKDYNSYGGGGGADGEGSGEDADQDDDTEDDYGERIVRMCFAVSKLTRNENPQ